MKTFIAAILVALGVTTTAAATELKPVVPPVSQAMGTILPDMKEAKGLKTPPEPVAVEEIAKKKDTKPEVVSGDLGGSIIEYIEKYNKLRQAEKKVRIEDLCLSACTLVIGLVPEDKVCVTPQTIFGFHSAWVQTMFGPVFHREATRMLWQLYPGNLQAALRQRGWDGEGEEPHPEFIYIKGSDLYGVCQ